MLLKAVATVVLLVMIGGCSAAEDAGGKPKARGLVFEDDFSKGLDHWQAEGPHLVEVVDGRLHVRTVQDKRNVGQFVWCRTELPDDFRIEWDVTPASESGFFLVFFCQKGVKGEDILGEEIFEKYLNWKTWKEYSDWDKYTSPENRRGRHQSRIRGYHLSYRRNEAANCNCRKNPGLVLVKSNEIDALLPKDRTAHAELTQTGGRIRLVVNGREFMDYTDPEDPYSGGRFGFRNVYDADAWYDNVRVFDLTAERGR